MFFSDISILSLYKWYNQVVFSLLKKDKILTFNGAHRNNRRCNHSIKVFCTLIIPYNISYSASRQTNFLIFRGISTLKLAELKHNSIAAIVARLYLIPSITKLKSFAEKPDWHYRTHRDVGMAYDLQRNNIGFATKMMVTTNPRILRPFSAWKLTLKCSGIMLFCYKHNFEWLMIIFLIYLIDYNLIGLIQPFIGLNYSFPFIFELYLLFWIEMCPDQL